MKFNLKRLARALLMITGLAIGGAMPAFAQTEIFTDTFDADPTNGATPVSYTHLTLPTKA